MKFQTPRCKSKVLRLRPLPMTKKATAFHRVAFGVTELRTQRASFAKRVRSSILKGAIVPEGWDLQSPRHAHRARHGFLTHYFCNVFVPYMWNHFRAQPQLSIVFWVEETGCDSASKKKQFSNCQLRVRHIKLLSRVKDSKVC